jgi:hypothetical protein
VAIYADAMKQKEHEIRENPKYNKTKSKLEESRISAQGEAKYGDDSNVNNSNLEEGESLNSSQNYSQLNKTARVQYHMSILQRNFAKIAPIFKSMTEMLVKEGGEKSESKLLLALIPDLTQF